MKISIGLFAIGGLVALALLAAELRNFTFREAEPFTLNLGLTRGPAGGGDLAVSDIPLWKTILFISLVLLIFIVLLVLLNRELRKRLLLSMLRSALTLAAVWLVMKNAYRPGNLPQVDEAPPMASSTQLKIGSQVLEYVPPHINPWLILGISFGIALVLVLAAWWFFSRRTRPGARRAIAEIAGIAREALNGLQPGADWDEAIVRAYVRMDEVVSQQRGFIRQPGSTPSEFAQRMAREGLPGEAVRTLTGLFEGVRYGGRKSSQQERDLAAAALSAILHACGVNA